MKGKWYARLAVVVGIALILACCLVARRAYLEGARADRERERAADLELQLAGSRSDLADARESLARASETGRILEGQLAGSRREVERLGGLLQELGGTIAGGSEYAGEVADGLDGDLSLLRSAIETLRRARAILAGIQD